jgi:predicted PurR-regulated permease PerM
MADEIPEPAPEHRDRTLRRGQYPDLVARAVFYLGLVAVLGLSLWSLRSTLTVLLAAFFFAYLLDPVVGLLERRGLKRGLAIGAMVGGGTLAAALLVALIVPFVSADLRELGDRLPARLAALAETAPRFIEDTFGIRPPADLGAWLADLADNAREAAPNLAGALSKHLAGFARGAAQALGTLVSLALVPLFAFYLLSDFTDVKHRLLDELVPARHHEAVGVRLDRIDDALGGFVRGQLTVCACPLVALRLRHAPVIGSRYCSTETAPVSTIHSPAGRTTTSPGARPRYAVPKSSGASPTVRIWPCFRTLCAGTPA